MSSNLAGRTIWNQSLSPPPGGRFLCLSPQTGPFFGDATRLASASDRTLLTHPCSHDDVTMSRLTAAPQSRRQDRHERRRRSGHVGDELAVTPISWSRGSTCFNVRFSRRAPRGVPPLTISGPRRSTAFGDLPPQIGQRRHVPRCAPVSVAHERPGRNDPPPSKEPATSRPIGTCGVRHCAGTTTQQRSAPRTMTLPGTPREARPRVVLPVSKEAAARPNSVVAALHSTTRATTLSGRRWDARGVPEGRI